MTTVNEHMDRLKASLAGFVKSTLNRVDYLGLYPGAVVKQYADLTLQVRPDDTRLPPAMDKLKIKHGLPGVSVKVSAGCRILVGWENGDPSKPYAALWEGVGTAIEIDITATAIKLNGGAQSVARVTDTVVAASSMAAWIGSVSTALGITPGPTDFGTISSGSSSVKSG